MDLIDIGQPFGQIDSSGWEGGFDGFNQLFDRLPLRGFIHRTTGFDRRDIGLIQCQGNFAFPGIDQWSNEHDLLIS